MPDTISPYALLKRCSERPNSPRAATYDLYSAAQQSAPDALFPCAGNGAKTPAFAAKTSRCDLSESGSAPDALFQPPAQPAAAPFVRKTHYIADIRSRHIRASERMQPAHPPSACVQTPPV